MSTLQGERSSRHRLRTWLSRAAALIAAIVTGAWALLIGTIDWIGRLAVGDAWVSTMKKMPDWVHLVVTTSPWVPSAACLLLTGFLIYLNWPHEPTAEITAAAPREVEDAGKVVGDMIVVDGRPGHPPAFRGRFAENGSEAIFYIEFSFFCHGVMGPNGWTQTRKIEIFRQARFGRDLAVAFPIVSHREGPQGGFWKLGVADDDKDPIVWNASYKGRITVLDAKEREQHVYFILIPHEREMPTVLGQHMFDHILTWERKPTGAGDPESLFE